MEQLLSVSSIPIVSFREIQHSMKFLSFFVHYAKGLYGCSETQFLRDLLPLVITTQALVYTADYEIEEGQKNGASRGALPWLKHKETVMQLLREHDVYTPEAEKEADLLTEYWDLENGLMSHAVITEEKLEKAILLRASDVMMLHRICEKKMGIEFPSQVWDALQDIEAIRDIEADLRQYEKDVKNNDFNIYRMFIRFYGENAAARLNESRQLKLKAYREKLDQMSPHFKERLEKLLKSYYEQRPFIEVPKAIE